MLNLLTDDLNDDIKKVINQIYEPYLIVTVGNNFRRDDGVGSYIFSALKNVEGINILDAGINPENIVEDVIALSPLHILFLDAADFKGVPGEIKNLAIDTVSDYTISTHTFPLSLICAIIQDQITVNIEFIGIQLKDANYGEGLSQEVEKSAIMIINALKDKNTKIQKEREKL